MVMPEDKIDCVLMKQSIQEQISKEMAGMSPAERLAYIKQQVQYNITNEDDLKQAAQRLDTHLKEIEDTRQTEITGTNPGTILDVRAKG